MKPPPSFPSRLRLVLVLLPSILFVASCNKDCRATGDAGNCICFTLYEPVCGCDGVTYENTCRAECAGIVDYSEGQCQ